MSKSIIPKTKPLSPSDRKRLQMSDIARLAGVSISTVSRALNGSSLVNDETRERVTQLAQSLNYSINFGAHNLRLQKNNTVAVVVPYDVQSKQHITDPFLLSIVGGIADALTDKGYDMLLSRVDSEHLDSAAQQYDSGKVIGVIIIGQWHHHDQLNALAARNVPLVVWGGKLPQQLYCSVGGDNVFGGFQATEHLLRAGRRQIIFLGDARLAEVKLRREGYLQAHKKFNITPIPQLEIPVSFEGGAVRAVMDVLFASKQNFDGVFACSDLLAIQAIQSLRAHGRSVPQHVSVVGYDDISLAPYFDPPLTSIHQPIAEAGEELVITLLKLLDGKRVSPSTLPVNLIVRASAP